MITNKAIVIALIAVLICILIMILCVLFLLGHSGKRNGKSKTKKRKAKKRVVKKPSSGNASRPGRGSSSAGPKTESGNKLPALKAQTDDDMQKYAEITKSYKVLFHLYLSSLASLERASSSTSSPLAKCILIYLFTSSLKKLDPGTAATPISRIIHSQNSRSLYPASGSCLTVFHKTVSVPRRSPAETSAHPCLALSLPLP